MRWVFIFCSILFLSGCCGPQIVLRKVVVDSTENLDTLDAEKFKFNIKFPIGTSKFKELNLRQAQGDKDSLIEVIGYRGMSYRNGSTKDTAVVAEFIPALKKIILRISERVDTVYVLDTIRVRPTDTIIRGNDISERLIWIISFVLTSIFIIVYKRYNNVRKFKK